jgi:hypothetical protein
MVLGAESDRASRELVRRPGSEEVLQRQRLQIVHAEVSIRRERTHGEPPMPRQLFLPVGSGPERIAVLAIFLRREISELDLDRDQPLVERGRAGTVLEREGAVDDLELADESRGRLSLGRIGRPRLRAKELHQA